MVKVYHPQISIRLIKVVQRLEAAAGIKVAARYGELTEFALEGFLGDGGSVKVSKGIKDPVGRFTITLADRNTDNMDSLYGLIEPMDLVEIRMAHNPCSEEGGYKLPIVMRGFVSEIRRDESMEAERSRRIVTITGEDYGKIFQIMQVLYIDHHAVGKKAIHGFKFLHQYKIDTTNEPSVKKFIKMAVKEIADKFIANMPWKNSARAKPFARLTPLASVEGKVSGQQVNQWPGGNNIYGLITQVCDVKSGFNEFFIIDREDDVAVVMRPTPFITPDGELIEPSSEESDWFPDEVTVSSADIQSLQVSRTDANVSNFFWVRAPHNTMNTDSHQRLRDQPLPVLDVPNCDPKLYGIRMMEATANLKMPSKTNSDSPSEKAMLAAAPSEIAWRKSLLNRLKDASVDAVVFERGQMRLKGNEKIRPGGYLRVERGGMVSRCYAVQVEYEFAPFHGCFTTVRFERGTGFVARAQMDSPYRAELKGKGVYGV